MRARCALIVAAVLLFDVVAVSRPLPGLVKALLDNTGHGVIAALEVLLLHACLSVPLWSRWCRRGRECGNGSNGCGSVHCSDGPVDHVATSGCDNGHGHAHGHDEDEVHAGLPVAELAASTSCGVHGAATRYIPGPGPGPGCPGRARTCTLSPEDLWTLGRVYFGVAGWEAALGAAAACVVDADHFVAAASWQLSAATSLPSRPWGHSLWFLVAVMVTIWVAARSRWRRAACWGLG